MENHGKQQNSATLRVCRMFQASPAHLRPISGPSPDAPHDAHQLRQELRQRAAHGFHLFWWSRLVLAAGKYDQKYGRNMTMLEGWQRIKFHPSSNLQIFNK